MKIFCDIWYIFCFLFSECFLLGCAYFCFKSSDKEEIYDLGDINHSYSVSKSDVQNNDSIKENNSREKLEDNQRGEK